LFHVIRTHAIGFEYSVNLFCRVSRGFGFDPAEWSLWLMPELAYDRTNSLDADMVIRLPIVHRARDLCVHLRTAQFLCRILRSDGRLHQRRSGEEEAAAFSH